MKIIKKLCTYFIKQDEKTDSLIASLQLEKFSLQGEIMQLKKELKESKTNKLPVTKFDDTNDEPTDLAEFDSYAGRVANFAEEILFLKLKNKIADARSQLSDPNQVMFGTMNQTRGEYDWFIRGIESGYWSIYEWCMQMHAYRLRKLQEEENNN